MLYGVPAKKFFKDLGMEIQNDAAINGAGALAFFLVLALFPGVIFLLSLLPYLPITELRQTLIHFIQKMMPGQAAQAVIENVMKVTEQRHEGLMSFGALFLLWSTTSGFVSVIDQLNVAYGVKEERSFLKVRGLSLLLTGGFFLLIVTSFGLIVGGTAIQDLVQRYLGHGDLLLGSFVVLRWAIVAIFMMLAYAMVYYFGPNVKQEFKFITPGSVFALVATVAASLGFSFYVKNFGSYDATYGSLGAVIILLMWLYIMGLVLIVGAEVNSLIEHYSPDGKDKGQKSKSAPVEKKPVPSKGLARDHGAATTR